MAAILGSASTGSRAVTSARLCPAMASASSFVHLRIHTEYSVVDSTLRIDAAAAAAGADGQPALAISDLNNLFGAVKFYTACRRAGIKPLIGVDVLLEPVPGSGLERQPSRLLLLVQNRTGYLNLCELLA